MTFNYLKTFIFITFFVCVSCITKEIEVNNLKKGNKNLNVQSSRYYPKEYYFVPYFLTNGLLSNEVPASISFSNGRLFVGFDYGISISDDVGVTFNSYTSQNEFYNYGGISYCGIKTLSGKIFVCSSGSGLGVSNDNGLTFQLQGVAQGLLNQFVMDAIYDEVNDILYVANFFGGLGISTDGGQTFTVKGVPDGLPSANAFKLGLDSSQNLYIGTDSGLAISTDQGATFVTKTTVDGLPDNGINNIFIKGSDVYVSTSSGLAKTSNLGVSFSVMTTVEGLGHNQCLVSYVDSNNNLYVGTQLGLSISSDGGASFTTKTTADGLLDDYISDIAGDGNTIFVLTSSGLQKSTNQGATFQNMSAVHGLPVFTGVMNSEVINNKIFISTSNGLGISSNGGETFDFKTTADGLGDNNVRAVLYTNSTMFVATINGLSISTDNGVTFINKTTADGLGHNNCTGLAKDSLGSVYISTMGGGLTVTSDLGASFRVESGWLLSTGLNDVYVDNNDILYLSGTNGLDVSTDGGNLMWAGYNFSSGLPENNINSTYAKDNLIIVATNSGIGVSTNGGASFTTKTTSDGLASNFVRHVNLNSQGHWYVSTDSGLSISQDNGATFVTKDVSDGLGNIDVQRTNFDSNGNIYIATGNGGLTLLSP